MEMVDYTSVQRKSRLFPLDAHECGRGEVALEHTPVASENPFDGLDGLFEIGIQCETIEANSVV